MIVIDFETHPITPGNIVPRPVCLAVATYSSSTVTYAPGVPDEWWIDVLREETIVGWNIAFDMACLAYARPHLFPAIFQAYREGRIICAMLAEQLIDIASGTYGYNRRADGGYSLDAVGQRRGLGGKHHDEWKLRYGELDAVPFDQWPVDAKEYPRRDVELTREIRARQLAEAPQYLADEVRKSRAWFALYLASARGMVTDSARIDVLEKRKRELIAFLEHDLQSAGLVRPDGTRNVKAVAARVTEVYQRDGRAVPMATKAAKTDALTCEESGDLLLYKYAQLSSEKTFVSNFIPTLRTGIVQPRYTIAESGRALSGNPNTQNFPRKGGVRECFVPRPGYLYGQADYGQLELHTLAQVCYDLFGRSALGDMLNRGQDAHRAIAASLLHLSYDEVKAHPQYDAARQSGKVANFGYPGGLGHKRFCDFALAQYGVRVTEGESRQLKAVWLSNLPEMTDYFAFIATITDRQLPITQLRSYRVRGGVGYTDACNTLFQGLGADVALDALFDVSERCYCDPSSPLYGSHPVNFIHDEIIIESPEECGAEAAEEMSRLMAEAGKRWLPSLNIKAPPTLSRRWSKATEEIRDEKGRLLAWDK